MKFYFLFIVLLWIFVLPVVAQSLTVLRIATTTSTENSGLLDVLHPPFVQQHNIRLDIIAVGTGKALKLGENGDVDVVFVHAPKAELAFVAAGFGVKRHAVMHNDFIIVGPADDPARISHSSGIYQALTQIYNKQAMFVSRGDDSGTHKKEKALWRAVGLTPKSAWYAQAGQGMGAILRIADEKQAYALTDRGTYIAHKDRLSLQIILEGYPPLFNPYHVIKVSPSLHPHIKANLAQQYINYITGVVGQKIIADYKLAGVQLFYPDANKMTRKTIFDN